MRIVLGVAVIYLALAVQAGLAQELMIAGAAPRLIPLAMCLVAVFCEARAAFCLAAAGGLAADCLSPGPYGIETAGCTLAVGCMLLAQRFAVDGWPHVLLPLSCAALLEATVAAAGQTLSAHRGVEPGPLASFVLRSTLATTLVAALLIVAVRGVSPRLPGRSMH